MIDEKHFDELWERAEAERYTRGLAAEYPAWHTRRRRTAGIVAGLALVVAVALPITLSPSTPAGCKKIYCNNSTYSDSHWISMADALLMS
jgi:hypothetical protein